MIEYVMMMLMIMIFLNYKLFHVEVVVMLNVIFIISQKYNENF
jgi:hypothetical protein